jgi:hypothetical protein
MVQPNPTLHEAVAAMLAADQRVRATSAR